ncbi:phosphotransferase [Dactylosporangium roseum]|uniref:Phosphotransferase n=1 Tax=Dactylosporangium roseum TaxID=47989 RepID=A0ABY5Z6U4_9ACTN|nr:aminoglycoside phosphotransferase family protein [Dactylosporangium roseum]UWZ36453.1 phosphotransferase [Dactylosporangium roseum]
MSVTGRGAPARSAAADREIVISRGVDDDKITGVIDWSEAAQGDALYDLAVLTLGHEEHLDDVVAGYGTDVDLDVIRGWWSWRSLVAVRWLVEHGFDPSLPGCEFDVLRSRM